MEDEYFAEGDTDVKMVERLLWLDGRLALVRLHQGFRADYNLDNMLKTCLCGR